MNMKTYPVYNDARYDVTGWEEPSGDQAAVTQDSNHDDPVYKDTVYSPDDINAAAGGNTGTAAFSAIPAEAKRAARWAWSAMTSALAEASRIPAKSAFLPSQPAVRIPLLRAEDPGTARHAAFEPPAAHAAILPAHPMTHPADPATKPIETQVVVPLRSSAQQGASAMGQGKALVNWAFGFGRSVAAGVGNVSQTIKTASIAAGISSIAAGSEAATKASDLWRERNDKKLEQAGSTLLASVIALHKEISHIRKQSGNIVGRATDHLAGLWKSDASPTQQAAATTAANLTNFWQCVSKAKSTQAGAATAFPPAHFSTDWPSALETPLGKLTCDELGQLRHALLKDEKTAQILAITMQPSEDSKCARTFMQTLARVAAAEAKSRYQDEPMADLARVGAARRGVGGMTETAADAAKSHARPLHDEDEVTKNALEKILRGFYASKIDQPNETVVQYLARLLHAQGSQMQDLRAALTKDNAVNGIFDMNPDAPMTAQYRRVFDDLRTLAFADAEGGAVKRDRFADPDRAIADAVPTHRPGWVRQLGHGLAFWGKYVFASPATQADMRVKYLQVRIDIKADDLQRALALGTDSNRNKARIESRLHTLHDAVDDLHVELSLQSSSRNADDYLQDSLLRSMGGYSPVTLKQLRHASSGDQWQPAAEPALASRLSRLFQRTKKAYGNPFHDPLKYHAEMKNRPPLGERVTSTWITVQHMIEQEPDVRDVTLELRQLATQIDKKTLEDKDYDAISGSIGKLITLDAKRDSALDVQSAALKRLSTHERGLIAKRLFKYSPQSGKDIIGFVKPDELGTAPIAQEDKWRYRVELTSLYSAAQSLKALNAVNADTAPETESPAQTVTSAESTQDITTDAKPVVDATSALSSVAQTVVQSPAAWTVTKLLSQAARSRA